MVNINDAIISLHGLEVDENDFYRRDLDLDLDYVVVVAVAFLGRQIDKNWRYHNFRAARRTR